MSLLDRFRKKKIEKKVEKVPMAKPLRILDTEGAKEPEKEISSRKIVNKKTFQVYQVIKEPHITEKATFLTEQDKYIFKIFSKANKIETKKAIESLYGVKVKKVSIIHLPSKRRRLGQSQGWRHGLKKGFKKAIVTLKKGEKIELLPR